MTLLGRLISVALPPLIRFSNSSSDLGLLEYILEIFTEIYVKNVI